MEEKDFRELLTDQKEEIKRHGEMLLEHGKKFDSHNCKKKSFYLLNNFVSEYL